MSNKANDELIPISSRMRRKTWVAMKQAAVIEDASLQDLLDEACNDWLRKREQAQSKAPARGGKGRT